MFSTNAETHYKPQIRVGGKAGVTMSQMSFSPSVSQKMTNGFIVGATFTYAEEKLFGLRAELCIEQRGWQEDYDELSHIFNYQRHLTYIQLPLLTQIQFGSAKFKGIITLGPEVAYMIGDNASANFDYNNIGTLTDYPVINRMNEQLTMEVARKFDYGISAGLGMQWNMTRVHAVSLEGRFYYGLGNIFPDRRRDVFSASRGMSIQVTLGYNFRLK
ncbi:MAG: PorT family protein [Muribaculaceae bacterium]|nr:PorT family protein [Muribaculaceae bacterium]